MQSSSPQNAYPRFSRTTKMILGGIAALLLIYFTAIIWLGVPTSIVVDHAQVAALARQVTDYRLPPGYTERAATTIAGVDRILIDDASEEGTIWLVTGWSVGSDTVDTELRQGIMFPKYRSLQWQLQDEKSATIRGQETPVMIYAGTDAQSIQYEAWASAFQGKNGPAILVIAAPQSLWDDARAQAFIDSMQ